MRDIINEVQRWLDSGDERVRLATVIRTFNSAPRAAGAKMAINSSGKIAGSLSGGCVEASVIEEAAGMSAGSEPKVLHFEASDERAWSVGLPCGGAIDVLLEPLDRDNFQFLREALQKDEPASSLTVIKGSPEVLGKKAAWSQTVKPHGTLPQQLAQRLADRCESLHSAGTVSVDQGIEAFVEIFPPPTTLVIVGGVHIAVALVRLAKIVGFRTVVIDPRGTFGDGDRFPGVDRLVRLWPEEAYSTATLTQATAVAVLTHDPKIDDPALAGALKSPAFYVGALGSARSQESRRQRLRQLGFPDADLARIRGPIGLDIGAANPEEIALAILSEIVATSRQGAARPRTTG
ncbi:MAG TPA: XdhC/CoxI family protein [Spirochaetia bacterium]|nr:XdhC/CoxI family protein [Spirochaetia bacterium]